MGVVGRVVLREFGEDDGAHRGLLGEGGALPVEAEALIADGAVDVLFYVRLSE